MNQQRSKTSKTAPTLRSIAGLVILATGITYLSDPAVPTMTRDRLCLP